MRMPILFLLLLTAAPAAAEPRENWAAVRLERAIAAYRANDYRAASRDLRRLAEHGSAIAETLLGVIHAGGKGVRPSDAAAAAYFYRAASRGYGPAQIAMSDAFATGRGVRASGSEAYFWALAATTGGSLRAEAEGRVRVLRLQKALSSGALREVEQRFHDWRPRAVLER